MADSAALRAARPGPHNGVVEDPEATQLILQTLFDIRWRVDDIHAVVVGGDDDGEAEEEDA